MLTRQNLRGIWAAVPTPFDDKGKLDTDRAAENVELMCQHGIDGIYCTGASGEFFALSFEEFARLVDVFVPAAHKAGKPVQVGCSWTYTREVIQRMEYAQKAAADGVQLSFPFTFAVNNAEMMGFFKDVTSACPGLPIVVFASGGEQPALRPVDYRRMANEVPELVGTKIYDYGVQDWIDLTALVPELAHFSVIETNLAVSMMYGAVGAYSALIFVAPELLLRLYRLCLEKRWEETIPLERRVGDFFRDVVLPLERKGYHASALDKGMAEVSGVLRPCGVPRPPYYGISAADLIWMLKIMTDKYPEFIYAKGEKG